MIKISAKINYACRALLELGLHWPNQSPVQISTIAKRQKVPIKFLIQIFFQLKQADIVESVRGSRGGYVLSKSPGEIRLSEIFQNLGGLNPSERKRHEHVVDIIWNEINESFLKQADAITLETICNRARSNNKTINFEI